MPQKPWLVWRTAIDGQLMQKSGFDELTLRRLRKALHLRFQEMPHHTRRAYVEGGAAPRFRLLVTIMRDVLSDQQWVGWLQYVEFSAQDIEEMCSGQYPISPYMIRVHSALFGIKTNFLLLGDSPATDEVGVNIDVWPMVR